MALPLKSVYEIIVSSWPNKKFFGRTALFSCGNVYCALLHKQSDSKFKSVDGNMACDHSNESDPAVLLCATASYPVYKLRNATWISEWKLEDGGKRKIRYLPSLCTILLRVCWAIPPLCKKNLCNNLNVLTRKCVQKIIHVYLSQALNINSWLFGR